MFCSLDVSGEGLCCGKIDDRGKSFYVFFTGISRKKEATCDYRHYIHASNTDVDTERKVAWKMHLKVLWKCIWLQENVGVKGLRSQKILLKSCTTDLFSENWARAAVIADLSRVQQIAISHFSQYWSSGDMSSDSQCRY